MAFTWHYQIKRSWASNLAQSYYVLGQVRCIAWQISLFRQSPNGNYVDKVAVRDCSNPAKAKTVVRDV